MSLIQSTSSESNSPCWNGLLPLFPINFTNKSFLYLGFLKKIFPRTLSTMYLTNPESFTQIGTAILEILDDKALIRLPRGLRSKPQTYLLYHTDGFPTCSSKTLSAIWTQQYIWTCGADIHCARRASLLPPKTFFLARSLPSSASSLDTGSVL